MKFIIETWRDLEMIDPPRDKILWELSTHGKMKKRDLGQRSGLRQSELDPVREELAREGKISISGEAISLIY
jgi:hypothetical protein